MQEYPGVPEPGVNELAEAEADRTDVDMAIYWVELDWSHGKVTNACQVSVLYPRGHPLAVPGPSCARHAFSTRALTTV